MTLKLLGDMVKQGAAEPMAGKEQCVKRQRQDCHKKAVLKSRLREQ
jgi:hypothetical protein